MQQPNLDLEFNFDDRSDDGQLGVVDTARPELPRLERHVDVCVLHQGHCTELMHAECQLSCGYKMDHVYRYRICSYVGNCIILWTAAVWYSPYSPNTRQYTLSPNLSRACRLNCGHACTFGRVDEAVSGGKPPAGKGVVGLFSWHGAHYWVCITFYKVRQGDSVTKPDYYYYCHTDERIWPIT